MSILLPTQSFGAWQPLYADHRIATFPVRVSSDGKVPAIRGWQSVGLPGSSQLAQKFAGADAFGFCPGRRSGLTILDVDTPDERVLADALDRYGSTPVIVRSGSGNYQAWYRNSGEKRLIRPEADQPIDILGNGFVVAPPSRGVKGWYQFIQGDLDDLERLPIMLKSKIASPPLSPDLPPIKATALGRNNSLWRYCMQSAHSCDDFDSLLDVARTCNDEYMPPLSDDEVVKIAASAWGYTDRGENRFGTHGAWLPLDEVNRLVRDPDVLALVCWLRANNRPDRQFWVADGLKDRLGWSLHQLREARRRVVKIGEIRQIEPPRPGKAAVYVFGKTSGFQR